jgi:hypothetical protein
VEVVMPEKGKEIKIKHSLNVANIINVNIIVVNGTPSNLIIRNQVDLITQKVLYNWYLDKTNLVIIRPNNVIIKYL